MNNHFKRFQAIWVASTAESEIKLVRQTGLLTPEQKTKAIKLIKERTDDALTGLGIEVRRE